MIIDKAAEFPSVVDCMNQLYAINVCHGVHQVQRHPVVTDRAAEFPSVAPVASGKPHQHAYTAGSRVVGEDKWGPQQVCFHFAA